MTTNIEYPPMMQKAITDVLKAAAKWRATDEIDKANKNKILAENNFRYCYPEGTPGAEKQGEKITNQRDDFLMSDEDFNKYCELIYAENVKSGIDSGGVGITFWDVQKAVIDAEDKLIDTVAAQLPNDYTPERVKWLKTSYKYRKEFLRITFGDSYIS